MSLVFQRIHTEGIAQLSYLLGDDGAGIAAVIDPTPDVGTYLTLARQKKVSITHIFETHIHADFMSGARELCARLGSAKVYLSHEGGARYGYENEQLRNGDSFIFGKTVMTARHTPGHTPEHMCLILAERKREDLPWGILTGDSLFADSAGRPDLLGQQTAKLTRQLFETLRVFYLSFPDCVIIHPGHGHGSPCGADIGDRLQSTIGYERRFNPYLQFSDFKRFKEHTRKAAPPVPRYYPVMKKLNAKGPEILGHLPRPPGLTPKAFKEAIEQKAGVLVDTRTMLAFGGGHIPGALNIGATPMLSIWAGWLLDRDDPLLLVLNRDDDLAQVLKLLVRTGYTRFAGYLAGGMTAWSNTGLALEEIRQMPVNDLKSNLRKLQVVDVRGPAEWRQGHVPRAQTMFLPELRRHSQRLAKTKPVAVYCDSGYRASIGASILQQEGFKSVFNVPGSWQAWQNAGHPIAEGAGAK